MLKFLALRTLSATYWEGEGGSGGGGGTTPPTDGGTTPPPPGGETWYGKAGIAAEHHEWLGNKQFADPNLLVASHRSLESLVGRQRLAVPSNAEDAEAYNALYKTLGRPDKPEYALPKDSKISGDELKFFNSVFHEAGLGQGQVEKVLTAYEKRAVELSTAAETERANAERLQVEALDKEWGSAAEANKDIASRAFRALGIDEATADKIESAIGYQATMKLFHGIGSGMSEAALKQDGNKNQPGGGGDSLGKAEGELKAKFADKDFMAKYMHSDPRVRKDAIAEIEAIQKRIAEAKGVK
jgi:hypothetical protein